MTTTPVLPVWTSGDRIRKAIEFSGHSVQEAADHLGVARNTVSNWMHGRSRPRLSDLRILAAFTGVDESWLVHGTGVTDGLGVPVSCFATMPHARAPAAA